MTDTLDEARLAHAAMPLTARGHGTTTAAWLARLVLAADDTWRAEHPPAVDAGTRERMATAARRAWHEVPKDLAPAMTNSWLAAVDAVLALLPPVPAQIVPAFPGASFFATDAKGQWHYVNHAGTWQGCPPPYETGLFGGPPGFCNRAGRWCPTGCAPDRPACGSQDDRTEATSVSHTAQDVINRIAALEAAERDRSARERNVAEIAEKVAERLSGEWLGRDGGRAALTALALAQAVRG